MKISFLIFQNRPQSKLKWYDWRDKQDGVDIWRPFLNISKQTIYNFAEMYKIPYFKDTTELEYERKNEKTIIS